MVHNRTTPLRQLQKRRGVIYPTIETLPPRIPKHAAMYIHFLAFLENSLQNVQGAKQARDLVTSSAFFFSASAFFFPSSAFFFPSSAFFFPSSAFFFPSSAFLRSFYETWRHGRGMGETQTQIRNCFKVTLWTKWWKKEMKTI